MEKVLILFSLLCATLISTSVPFRLAQGAENCTRQKWRKHGVDWLNCFAGGVFLSTMLLHLFPEASEGFKQIMDHYDIQTSYPLAQLTICCGLFIILFLETVLIKLSMKSDDGLDTRQEQEDQEQRQKRVYDSIQTTTITTAENIHSETLSKPEQELTKRPECNTYNLAGDTKAMDEVHPLFQSSVPMSKVTGSSQIQRIRSFVLLTALSVHAIFEGLVLGLTNSSHTLWKIFTAVLIHKSVVGFSLGSQFAENFPFAVQSICYMVLFSSMSPVGIGIGTVISEVDAESFGMALVGTILQCLATGTFLHVTFFEVLVKQVGNHQSFINILIVFIGFISIAIVAIFTP